MDVSANVKRAPSLLLFGARGAIGSAVKDYFLRKQWRVVTVGRPMHSSDKASTSFPDVLDVMPTDIAYDMRAADVHQRFAEFSPFDAVCWAQGMNVNDSVYTFEPDLHMQLYEANCLSIALSLQMLLEQGYVTQPSRFCIVSSIWQEITRQNKFSYSMTKSALRGLVLSAAADLGQDGHLMNAVLPGVLETPMTRASLTDTQISAFEQSTLFGRLAGLEDVTYAIWSLLNHENQSLTGQFIKVDLGYSNARII